MKKIGVALFVFLFPLGILAYTSPGIPRGFVNDYASMLTPATVTSLEAELADFATKTTNEITVVTIASYGEDETIETYATKLFEEWKIGKEKQDNGVLLLVARDNREVRIEVGYGLEPVLTDIESSHIISDVITPAFKAGDFDKGVTAAVHQIETAAAKEYPVQADSTNGAAKEIDFSGLSRFYYPFFFGLIALASFLGKSKSWWAGGIIGGILGLISIMFIGLVTGLLATLVLIFLGLAFDYFVSKSGGSGRGPFPPFFMGGGGFGGGSGGGFGGFGGGMSGGGGASGKW